MARSPLHTDSLLVGSVAACQADLEGGQGREGRGGRGGVWHDQAAVICWAVDVPLNGWGIGSLMELSTSWRHEEEYTEE